MFEPLISKLNRKYVIFSMSIGIVAIFLKIYALDNSNSVINTHKEGLILSNEELAKFDGIHTDKLYLSVIGNIFDVTDGKKHYAEGSPYHYFIGKDGTRALVTGNFKDESSNRDNVLDLTCDNLFAILNWRQTFKGKYKFVGFLAGRYYNENGMETSYMIEFKQKLNQCKLEKEEAKKQDQLYPPCNIAWSEEDGTRLWCTKSSGGIERSWVGVPRQLFTPGAEKPWCVCLNPEKTNTHSLLKEYEGCPSDATHCVLNI